MPSASSSAGSEKVRPHWSRSENRDAPRDRQAEDRSPQTAPAGRLPRVLARLDASRRHLDARIREAFGVFQHE